MKVALVYDRVNKWGGAERVLLTLHKLFPKAPLFTSVYHSKKALWAKDFKIKTSFLQTFPKAKTAHENYAVLMPLAFESFSFDDYDLVISVTSEAAKGIITKPETLHICYCLTPTRYLWSGYNDYFKSPLFKLISKPAVLYLRHWDKHASKRPDVYIAISNEVKKRIKKYYQRDSHLVFPPLSTILNNQSKKKITGKNYFLVVSRLVAYKRVDIAIKAFNILGWPLKIIGTGKEEQNLKKIAKKNIDFLGNVKEEDLALFYKNAKALIFPGVEDFGLVMVEAQSFGIPVIAFKKGGALDIIREGETGDFFEKQNARSLIEKLKKINWKRYNTKLSIKNSKRFLEDKFKRDFLSIIEKELKKRR